MTGIIYAYRNRVNGKHYVGQTIHPANRHRTYSIGRFGHSWKFAAGVKKYGFHSFEYEILLADIPREDLNAWEQYFVWLYRSFSDGYNLTRGGDFDVECHADPEFKAKKSAGIRRAWNRPGYREMMGEKMRMAQSDPAVLARKSQSQRNAMARPETKKRVVESAIRVQTHISSRLLRSKPIICIETGEWFLSTYDVKSKKGHDPGSINRACNGITKRVGGFHWRFATKEETALELGRQDA